MSSPGSCLACDCDELEGVIHLGTQRPVNDLLKQPSDGRRLALGLNACVNCGHGQLTYFANSVDLFSDYLYSSSTSGLLRSYQDSFSNSIARALVGKVNSRILEIASNDGLLLEMLTARGLDVTGFEPAQRMAERSIAKGFATTIGFWPEDSHELLGQKFDLVIGQNVLAHTPRPLDFLVAVREHLNSEGVAIFQTSQADMVANGEFDTIYHEHYSFFCERSAEILGKRAGFSHFASRYAAIHGNSALFFFAETKKSIGRFVAAFDARESDWDRWRLQASPESELRVARGIEDWRRFGQVSRERMKSVRKIVTELHAAGRRVIAVGAAAKAITFLRAADIAVDGLVDEASDKIGMWVDGVNIHISSMTEFEYSSDDFFLLTAWNFSSELSTKLVELGISPLAQACTYFPSVRVDTLGAFRA